MGTVAVVMFGLRDRRLTSGAVRTELELVSERDVEMGWTDGTPQGHADMVSDRMTRRHGDRFAGVLEVMTVSSVERSFS